MVITQAGLGPRVAELLALRVQDVDFLRRTVRVEFQTTRTASTEYRPRHQDHDAPCRYRKWSARHSGSLAARSFRRIFCTPIHTYARTHAHARGQVVRRRQRLLPASRGWSRPDVVYTLAWLLVLLALPGLHAAQRGGMGRLGLAGFLTAFSGTHLIAVTANFGFLAPVLAEQSPAVLDSINQYLRW
jgi:integrase